MWWRFQSHSSIGISLIIIARGGGSISLILIASGGIYIYLVLPVVAEVLAS